MFSVMNVESISVILTLFTSNLVSVKSVINAISISISLLSVSKDVKNGT